MERALPIASIVSNGSSFTYFNTTYEIDICVILRENRIYEHANCYKNTEESMKKLLTYIELPCYTCLRLKFCILFIKTFQYCIFAQLANVSFFTLLQNFKWL